MHKLGEELTHPNILIISNPTTTTTWYKIVHITTVQLEIAIYTHFTGKLITRVVVMCRMKTMF